MNRAGKNRSDVARARESRAAALEIGERLAIWARKRERERVKAATKGRLHAVRQSAGGVGRRPERQQRTGSVERFVQWAFQDERLGWQDAYGGRSQSTDTLVVLERIAAVGCRIDYTGPAPERLHPDAGALAGWLGARTPGAFRVVAGYGESGLRPTTRPDGALRVEPRQWQRQRRHGRLWAETEVHKRYSLFYRGRLRHYDAVWCPVRYVNRPEDLAREREEYVCWRDLLAWILEDLKGRLRHWTLTEELPPETPWLLTEPQNLDRRAA